MPYKLDTNDMERWSVEFRLSVEKAHRRFTLAEMSDVFERILKNHLPSLENEQQNKASFIKMEHYNHEEFRKLEEFSQTLVERCTRLDQHNSIQQVFRNSLLSSRRKSILIDQSKGDTLSGERFCYFCGGDENSIGHNHDDKQKHNPSSESMLAIGGDNTDHNDYGTSTNANDDLRNDDVPPTKRQRCGEPETPPPDTETATTIANTNAPSSNNPQTVIQAVILPTTHEHSYPNGLNVNNQDTGSQEIPMQPSLENMETFGDPREPQVQILEDPQMTPPMSTGAPTPDLVNYNQQQKEDAVKRYKRNNIDNHVALELKTWGRVIPRSSSDSDRDEHLARVNLKSKTKTKQTILTSSSSPSQSPNASSCLQQHQSFVNEQEREISQEKEDARVPEEEVFVQADYSPNFESNQEFNSNQSVDSLVEWCDNDNIAEPIPVKNADNNSKRDRITPLTESTPKKRKRFLDSLDSCLSERNLVIDEKNSTIDNETFNETVLEKTESQRNDRPITIRYGPTTSQQFDSERPPSANDPVTARKRLSSSNLRINSNSPLHSKSIRSIIKTTGTTISATSITTSAPATTSHATRQQRAKTTDDEDTNRLKVAGISQEIYDRLASPQIKDNNATNANLNKPSTANDKVTSNGNEPIIDNTAISNSQRARTKKTSKRKNKK